MASYWPLGERDRRDGRNSNKIEVVFDSLVSAEGSGGGSEWPSDDGSVNVLKGSWSFFINY